MRRISYRSSNSPQRFCASGFPNNSASFISALIFGKIRISGENFSKKIMSKKFFTIFGFFVSFLAFHGKHGKLNLKLFEKA